MDIEGFCASAVRSNNCAHGKAKTRSGIGEEDVNRRADSTRREGDRVLFWAHVFLQGPVLDSRNAWLSRGDISGRRHF